MLFLKDLNVFHIDGKEIPCITNRGAPDNRFPGAPGSLYLDNDTGCLYVCTTADILQNAYSWKIVGNADSETVQQAVSDYLTTHPVAGSGISHTAIELLITILQNVVFTSNQTSKIASLEEALLAGSSGDTGSGDSSGDDDTGGEETVVDDITIADGVMTIVTVGSAITVSDGVMTIA